MSVKQYNANKSVTERIFINDDLTNVNCRLRSFAKSQLHDHTLNSCWSSNSCTAASTLLSIKSSVTTRLCTCSMTLHAHVLHFSSTAFEILKAGNFVFTCCIDFSICTISNHNLLMHVLDDIFRILFLHFINRFRSLMKTDYNLVLHCV